MKFYYQILSTPTADTPGTAVLLHFPDRRYILGQVSEGTQRACTENGTKLTSVSDIFISGRMEWGNTGGLIGMILTKADARANADAANELLAQEKEANRQKRGAPTKNGTGGEIDEDQHDLTIHGARNLAHTLATARRFVFRKGLPVYTKEYDAENTSKKSPSASSDPFAEPTWCDENIKVWVMPVTRSAPSPRSQSPRKRSLDEFRNDEFHEDTNNVSAVDQQSKDQLSRHSVVASMFHSDWTLDAMEESRLADVKMPAQIWVRNPETKDLEKYEGPLPGGEEPVPDIQVLVRKPWPGASVSKIPTTTKCEDSMCYIIKNYDVRGKFDPKKAIALGVPKGPNFGALTNGKSVTSADGKLVTPDMVLDPPTPGKGMAIIDLPTPQYVESLVTRPEWKSPAVVNNLEAFIWILGSGVGDHPRLREFVAAMSKAKHIVSSPDYCPNYLTMQAAAESAIRMARLRPTNYAVPVHDNQQVPQTTLFPTGHSLTVHSFEAAEPGLMVRMIPQLELIRTEVVPRLNAASVLQKMPVSAEERARKINKKLKHPMYQAELKEFLKDLPGANAEIFTLGTGSSAPSKYRNVSSTLIHVPNKGYYLLDCGEDTLGQLKRMFPPEKLSEVLQNLRMIWVSHLHADHHLGTVSVCKAWYQVNYPSGVPKSNEIEQDLYKILAEKRLFIVSDSMMVEWLEEYASVEDFGFAKLMPISAYPFRDTEAIKTSFLYRYCRWDGSYPGREVEDTKPAQTELRFGSGPYSDALREATGLQNILTTYVMHCRGSMAVSLVFDDGFKVSFSGDCRPSPSFAEIGKDSTVLIHEATFGDDMAGSALAKRHSTTGEALKVGREMRARAILLTHFSQRYQKVSTLENSGARGEPRNDKKELSSVPVARSPPPSTKTPDIPLDDDVQEDLATQTAKPFQTSAAQTDKPPPTVVPIVEAFDLMRVRVGDLYTLEHHAPAIQKLFDMLDRAAAIEARQNREQRIAWARANKDHKSVKRHAQWLLEQADKGKAKSRSRSRSSSPGPGSSKGKPKGEGKGAAKVDNTSSAPRSFGRPQSRSPSPPTSPLPKIWDAPDSDSGWWGSSSESEKESSSQNR
ncbi:hypothetical protein BDV18DRAFT_131725 [Aspergillus unguis]